MFYEVTGLSKKTRQGYQSFKKSSAMLPDFLKLSGKVIELFKKIVHKSYRTFRKLPGKVIGLFGKNMDLKHTF